MERGDLLSVNGGIFRPQGQAINDHAASDVRVLVVGNPCNTNCLIAQSNAPDVPADRWFAMTRLDENRAKTQLAKKAGVHHRRGHATSRSGATTRPRSSPTSRNARIDGTPGARGDHRHARGCRATFIETVQKRGAAVIEKRGASSAASAAHAAIDSVNSVHFADARRRLALARGRELGRVRRARGPAVRLPGPQRRLVVVGRRGHRARRVRAGQDRRHHRRSSSTSATRCARSGCSGADARAVRWSLEFARRPTASTARCG